MSAADTTRKLRDRSRPINERCELAQNIITGIPGLYLPKPALVVVDWVLDSISSDAGVRVSPKIWDVLTDSWVRLDSVAQTRALQTHNLVSDVCSALEAGTDHELFVTIARALGALDPLLQLTTDQEASRLALASLKFPFPALGQAVWNLVQNKSLTVPADSLELLLKEPNRQARSAYLLAFVSNKEHPVSTVAADHAPEVFGAVLRSGVEVDERFNILASTYPSKLRELLEKLRGRLSMPPLKHIISTQAESASKDWGTLRMLLELDPSSVLDNYEKILPKGYEDFDVAFMAEFTHKSAQLRKLPDLLPHYLPQWYLNHHEVLGEALRKAVSTLSPAQVVAILEKNPTVIVPHLTYTVAAHTLVKPILEEILLRKGDDLDWMLRKSILDVLPSSADIVEPISWLKEGKHDDMWRELSLLRLYELRQFKGLELDYRVEYISLYPIVYEVEADPAIISDVLQKQSLTDVNISEWEECPKLYGALIEAITHRLPETQVQLASLNPAAVAAVGKVREVLGTCWGSGRVSMPLAGKFLKMVPKLYKDLTANDIWLGFTGLEAVDAGWYGDIIHEWIKNDSGTIRRSELAKLAQQAPPDTWSGALVRAYGGVDPTEALKWVRRNAQSPAAVHILEALPADILSGSDIAAELVLAQPSDGTLRFLCQVRRPQWPEVLAYHIWANGKCRCAFVEYFAACEDPEALWHASLLAARCGHSKVLQHLSELWPRKEPRYGDLVTLAAVKTLAEPNYEFAGLIIELVTERQWLLSQFAIEAALLYVRRASVESWEETALMLSRILLFQRHRLQGRMHLVVRALIAFVLHVTTVDQAKQYVRLVTNLCSPGQLSGRTGSSTSAPLTSMVAKERRNVAKHAGVLLEAHVKAALTGQGHNPGTYNALEPAAFALFDVLGNDELRAVTAAFDGPTRSYLRSIYDNYKAFGRWRPD